MASFGNGYGSECHLLRYLGRHRARLNKAVQGVTGGIDVRWLDFPFSALWPNSVHKGQWPDSEWLSLEFLPQDSAVVQNWRERWPHGSGVMNWDAVGEVKIDNEWEWILIEAKGHLGEIKSNCAASAPRSIELINNTLSETKAALGAPQDVDWRNGYYQYANRLAVLHHLESHGVGARLIFIYFCGDVRPDKFVCPMDAAGWSKALSAQENHLGIPKFHPIAHRIHKLFLPVGEATLDGENRKYRSEHH